MTPIHHYYPVLAQPGFLRRWARRIAILSIVGGAAIWGLEPLIAKADTVAGYPTTGCMPPGGVATLYSNSAVGIKDLSITFSLRMYGAPTVAQGQWFLSNGAVDYAEYWQSTQTGQYSDPTLGYSAYVSVHTVTLVPGSSGTVAFKIGALGYASGSCISVTDVRITFTRYGPGTTPPPGNNGGGFTATPTPAATNTVASPVPGATAGPGTDCFFDATVWQQVCFPKAPAGQCWVKVGLPDKYQLQPCGTPPTAVPGSTANPTCAQTHWWCWQGTTNTSSQSMPFLQITAGVTYNYSAKHAGCGPGSCGGTWDEFQKIDFSGSGSNCVFGGFNYGNSGNRFQYVGNGESMPKVITGTVSKTLGQDAGVCNFLIQSGSSNTRTAVYGNTGTTWEFWFDPVGWTSSSIPTDMPGSTIPAATTPPTPPGGLQQPPNDGGNAVNICNINPYITACAASFPPGVCSTGTPSANSFVCSTAGVNICAANPNINACQTIPPTAPSAGPYGSADYLSGADALASGLRNKAPFGYGVQAADALTTAFGPGYLAGAAPNLCFTLPVWAPAAAGGTHNAAETCIPTDSFTAMAPARTLFLAILVVAFGLLMLRTVVGAVGAKGTSGE